jgi:hypothetical protein
VYNNRNLEIENFLSLNGHFGGGSKCSSISINKSDGHFGGGGAKSPLIDNRNLEIENF